MRLVWFLILLGCGALSASTLVQAHSILKELEDEFVKEGDMAMEMMEVRPIARAILVHSPAEAAKERGYSIPLLDKPGLPSMRAPEHATDTNELHTAQHASITRGIDEQVKRRCIQLLAHQRKMDRKIDDLKKAGKTENLDELLSQSDEVHALTAVDCKTPE